MVGIGLKWGQKTGNVEGVKAAPIPAAGWMKKIPLVDKKECFWKVAMVVEPPKQHFLS